jgi:uncharacterized membrane protein YdbT with pleckstrin-like domain
LRLRMEWTYEDEDEEVIVCRGRFSDRLLKFKIVSAGLPLLACPPLLLIYLLVLPAIYAYFNSFILSLQVILTGHTLTVRYGSYSCCGCLLWNQVERKLALEKITDVTLEASWLHRYFGLERLLVRTASSSAAVGGSGQGAYDMGGADIALDGLVDCREFRSQLMRARAQLEGPSSTTRRAPQPLLSPDNDRLLDLLDKQLQVLTRLEQGLAGPQKAPEDI